jgi:hypothetical protein
LILWENLWRRNKVRKGEIREGEKREGERPRLVKNTNKLETHILRVKPRHQTKKECPMQQCYC